MLLCSAMVVQAAKVDRLSTFQVKYEQINNGYQEIIDTLNKSHNKAYHKWQETQDPKFEAKMKQIAAQKQDAYNKWAADFEQLQLAMQKA